MNFYKHHLGDYAQATAHLSFVEDAAYSRLIRKYYAEEQPLPADVKAVQRLAGARTRDEKQAVSDILEEFFELREDGWHNKRCDAEIERANAQAETNRQIAVQREARRKERVAANERTTNRDQTGNESLHESLHESLRSREPSQTPDTRHQTPDKTGVPESRSNSPGAVAPLSPHRTQIESGFDPDEPNRRTALSLSLDVDAERERFVAHYTATGDWRANWQSQFRKWLLDSMQHAARASKLGKGSKPTPGQRTADAAQRWLESQPTEDRHDALGQA